MFASNYRVIEDVLVQIRDGVFEHELHGLDVVGYEVEWQLLVLCNGYEVTILIVRVTPIFVEVTEHSNRL
jgi:hypothetical protein